MYEAINLHSLLQANCMVCFSDEKFCLQIQVPVKLYESQSDMNIPNCALIATSSVPFLSQKACFNFILL